MRWSFAVLPLVVLGLAGITGAFAEPLEQINTNILESSVDSSTVQISWNHDESATRYEAGCVSCMPNTVNSTENDTITLHGVTALNNGNALLFIVAYNDAGDIIKAEQIIIEMP